jgi:hypothetical protein
MAIVRRLVAGDEATVDGFLAARAESSLLLPPTASMKAWALRRSEIMASSCSATTLHPLRE